MNLLIEKNNWQMNNENNHNTWQWALCCYSFYIVISVIPIPFNPNKRNSIFAAVFAVFGMAVCQAVFAGVPHYFGCGCPNADSTTLCSVFSVRCPVWANVIQESRGFAQVCQWLSNWLSWLPNCLFLIAVEWSFIGLASELWSYITQG